MVKFRIFLAITVECRVMALNRFKPISKLIYVSTGADTTWCSKEIGPNGGTLELRMFGLSLNVPENAVENGRVESFSIKAISEIPKLESRQNEIFPCFGFKCSPSGLSFKVPVTITLSHCAALDEPSKVSVVLYTSGQTTTGNYFCD